MDVAARRTTGEAADARFRYNGLMREAAVLPVTPLASAIAREGYALVPAATMHPLLASSGPLSDWVAFEGSWDDLPLDTYMADGGRYRRRRHAVYSIGADGAIVREAHQPHYQSRDYNPLNGGIARWFEPIAAGVGEGPSMRTILELHGSLFRRMMPGSGAWRVEAHQFRIEARRGESGRPTPEGMHRDGVDYALVLLINRRNIGSGTTTIHALDGVPLGAFTLTDPFDAALVDDARVYHGVTPVEAVNPGLPAYRDVLVVTFRMMPAP
jgi:hypothetical protein